MNYAIHCEKKRKRNLREREREREITGREITERTKQKELVGVSAVISRCVRHESC
jgi:hypothetical protein